MTDDAEYILDLFRVQLNSFAAELVNTNIRRERFDKFSYSSWAIQETVNAISDYEKFGYVSVSVIRSILKEQQRSYEMWYNSNMERHIRYKYALETVEYLLRLTGGYCYE